MLSMRAIMVPHPPLILPQIGKDAQESVRTTAEAYREAARFIADFEPDTIIVLSPHSVMYGIWFHISPGERAGGNFIRFGAGNLRMNVNYDMEFVDALCALTQKTRFSAGIEGEIDPLLDHGTMIPLRFLQEAYEDLPLPPVVRIGLSCLPLSDHYTLGMLIRKTAEKLRRRVAVVASGDLSHRLKEDGPYGYHREGPRYDARIMDVMGRAAFGELFAFPDAFCEAAGECGHRSFTIMAGCFDGEQVNAKALSYEAPFGVGYGVCTFESGKKDASRRFLETERRKEDERLRRCREREDAYVRLARLSVENHVCGKEQPELTVSLPDELLNRRAGVFVTLRKNGRVRGCMGTVNAATDNLAEEIVQNAVNACSQDPLSPPVGKGELSRLSYSVDVLGEAEDIASPGQLDVKRYGVIVSNGRRSGLLLPDLEGVETIEEQIVTAMRKAGIGSEEKIQLQRFEVERHF